MYHIGIDVAKDHHDALGLDDAGKVVLPPFRFTNTHAGVDELVARLEALSGSPAGDGIHRPLRDRSL